MNRLPRAIAAALLAAGLSACVMVPKTVASYDPECRILVKQMTIEPVQLAYFGGCVNDGCVALLAAAGATAAASMVISGTIAIAGNVVYWAERQGTCRGGHAPVPPPLPPASPAPVSL